MASFEVTLSVWDVGGVIQTLYALAQKAIQGRIAVSYHVSVGATDGYRSVLFGYTNPGIVSNTYNYTILFMGCAATEKIGARQVTSAAGILAPIMLRGYPPSDPISGFGAAVPFWETYFVQIIVTIMNEWTNAIAEAGTVLSYEPIDEVNGTAAVAISVQTDGEVSFLPLQMLYNRITDNLNELFNVAWPAPAAASTGASVVVLGSDNSAIVQALQDIALRSTVTSINDRTAIFELGTNDIIIPGS